MRPAADVMAGLARSLGVSLAWLVDGTGSIDDAGPAPAPAPAPVPTRTVDPDAIPGTLRELVRRWRAAGTYPHEVLDELAFGYRNFSKTDLPELGWKTIADGLLAQMRGKAEQHVVEAGERDEEAERLAQLERDGGAPKGKKLSWRAARRTKPKL